MNSEKASLYQKLNFGTKPTTVDYQEIKVTVNPQVIMKDYAQAYLRELNRRNPDRGKEVGLTEEELFSYFTGLLSLRIQCINDVCKEWRRAKSLYIPSWIEFNLTMVGTVIDRDRGLKFTPVMDMACDIQQLLVTSEKLAMFIPDGVVLHKNAMPREKEGHPDVMGMIILQNFIVSQTKLPHPIASYAAAFLGLKLEQEKNFAILYRIRYDDIGLIRDELIAERLI